MAFDKKTILAAGGVLAIAGLLTGNEIQQANERAAAVAEFRQSPSAEIAKRKPGQEIRSLRGANRQVYRIEDRLVPIPSGKRELTDSTGAVIGYETIPGNEMQAVPQVRVKVFSRQQFFRDADVDTLRPLDLTVREVSALAALNPLRTHDHYVDAGLYTVRWMDDRPWNYRMDVGDSYVQYRLLTVDGMEIDIGYTDVGVKETITLADPSAAHTIQWRVKTSGTLEPVENNGYVIRENDGSAPIRIEEPSAWDRNGQPVMAVASVAGDTLTFRVTVLPGQEYPVTVDPSTTVNAVTAQSGYINKFVNDDTWLNARDATSGTASAGDYYYVGSTYSTPNYNVSRSFLSFPIGIANMLACSACTLYVAGNTDDSDTEFSIHLKGARSYKAVLEDGDFDQFNGWAASGAYDTTKVLNNAWHSTAYSAGANAIVFNATGRDSLLAAKADTLWIVMISNRDEIGTQPTGNERIIFYNSAPAYISFTFTYPSINPPTNFQVLPIAGSSNALSITWNNNWSSSIDSLVLYTYPDSVRVATLTKTASSAVIGNLSPFAKARYYIRADSAGYYGYSNPDSSWTCQTFKTENFAAVNYSFTSHVALNPDYNGIRGENSADSLTNSLYIGQRKAGSNYDVMRGATNIALPAMMKIKAESLFVFGTSDSSLTDFTITLRSGLWGTATATLAKYFTFDGWQSGTTAYTGTALNNGFSTSGFTTGATANKLVFTQAGCDTTLKRSAAGDSLKFVMLSSKDVSATAPTQAEFVQPDLSTSYLRLTYAPPDSAPTGFTLTSISTDSLLASWTDRSKSEYGYVLVEEATGNKVAGTDTVVTAGARLETNGAFNDTTGWTSSDGRVSKASVAGGVTGNCLQITQQSASKGPVFQNVTLVAGRTYRLTAYVKTGTSGNESYKIQFGSTNYGTEISFTSGTSSASWELVTLIWTADRTGCAITVYKNTTTAGTMLFDEVTLIDITSTVDTYARTMRVGGLSTNTSYAWKIKAVGGGADGLTSAADSCYTLAATPGLPTVTFPADSLLKFVFGAGANPPYTGIAVQDSISGLYVHRYTGVPDSFKADEDWATFAEWGAAAGDTVAAGVGKKYTIRIKARSGQ